MWKQSSPLHQTFRPLNACLREDWFLLPFELRLQHAHACALESAGILSSSEQAALCAALDDIEATCLGNDCPDSDAEDLHTWLEDELTRRTGEAGKKIHTARSRNDQVATLLTMYVIDAGQRLAAGLGGLTKTCCMRAKDWADIAFPLHTHQQFAAPGSVGFWAMRYAVSFDRAGRRLLSLLEEWSRYCPLGSGAVAGSSIPIDRAIQAEALKFAAPSPNALYSTTTRDECLEYLALASQIALHLQSLATDVILFSQTPLNWTAYPPDFGTGSSMMPNKLNPDAMELLRGRCNAVIAAHAELVTILKGLPSGYNRDLQCVKPVIRNAAETLDALLGMTAAFLQHLEFNPDRIEASLSLGHINATLRMEENVLTGAPLREAHHGVADEIAASADASSPVIESPLHRYRTTGSAHPTDVRRSADAVLDSIASNVQAGLERDN